MLVLLILVTGVAGTVLALSSREEDPQFVARQQALAPVQARQLETLITTTTDPRPGFRGRARAAGCRAGTSGTLGNPWTCVVRYPRQPLVRYQVIVYADGSILGSGQPEGRPLRGVLTVRGCCVGGP